MSDGESAIYWVAKESDAAISFIVLATLFTTFRFSTRWTKDKVPIWWDDYLIIPGFVVIIALCALFIVESKATLILMDQSQSDSAIQSAYVLSQKVSYASSALYPIACAFPKLSICCLYLRIFTSAHHVNRVITYILIAFLTANAIAFFVPSAAACDPPSALWEYPPDLSRCLDLRVLGTWTSLPHLVTDLIMMAMPMPMIWRMNADWTKRFGLTIVFLAAGLGFVGGIARLSIYIHTIYFSNSNSPDPNSSTQTDTSLALLAAESITTLVEPGMYFLAACLPPILGSNMHQSLDWVRSTVGSIFKSRSASGRSSGKYYEDSDEKLFQPVEAVRVTTEWGKRWEEEWVGRREGVVGGEKGVGGVDAV